MVKNWVEFHELEEKAKKEAADKVWERELNYVEWSCVSDEISEGMEYKLKEAGFDFNKHPVTWEHDGYRANLSKVEAWLTEEKRKELLDAELYEDFEHIEEISGGYAEEYFFDQDAYTFEFDYYANEDIEDMVEWITKYKRLEPENLNKYRIHVVMKNEEKLDEMRDLIEDDYKHVGKTLCKSVEEALFEHVSHTQDALETYLTDTVDYYESSEYIYDALENDSYLTDKYVYLEDGTPLERDDLIAECHHCCDDLDLEDVEIRKDQKGRCYAICYSCIEEEQEKERNIQIQKNPA